MSIPIITIHLADREHLVWVLAQARQSNPNSNIVLIGDDSSQHYRFIEHENIGSYFQEAQEFKKIYRHLSHNSLSYELLCFQRWFVLKQFMEAKKLATCFCIDSDVMLYADIEEEQNKFANFDMALYQKWVPSCVLINNLNILKEFCVFLVDIYTNSAKLEMLELEFKDYIPGTVVNICDMILFYKFCHLNPDKIGDLSEIIDDSTYDSNINSSQGFEMNQGRKNIYFLDNQPFCKHLDLDKDIRFNALHLQGYSKVYASEYFTGDINFKKNLQLLFEGFQISSQDNSNIDTDTYKNSIKSIDSGKGYVILPLKLGEINLIIFPDWSELEQSLCLDLERVFKAIATHPDKRKITLIVDQGNLSKEEVNLALSGSILSLFMQEELEISEEPDLSLVEQLDEMQWKALLNLVQARIVLEKENKQAIAAAKAENLPLYEADKLIYKRAVQLETGSWVLQSG